MVRDSLVRIAAREVSQPILFGAVIVQQCGHVDRGHLVAEAISVMCEAFRDDDGGNGSGWWRSPAANQMRQRIRVMSETIRGDEVTRSQSDEATY